MTPHRKLLADYAESGSEEAFRELVSAYVGMVHGAALRLVNGNSQLAEDVAQTVFTDLARRAKTLSPDVIVGGWLHRRTCNAAATAMRSERRRLVREREAVEMNSPNCPDPLEEVRPVLDEAINQLSDNDRDALMLRFFDRCNLRAVGEAMGTSEAAAQKRVERALEKLRGLLGRRGVVLSAAALALAMGSASATAAPAGLAVTVSTGALTSAPAGAGLTLTTLKIMAISKLKITLITGAVALLAAGTTTTVILMREPSYTPIGRPVPQKILQEAQADARAGRYQEALAKHIWYRKNALQYQPEQVGVRDSFALQWWAELAQKYPPAMKRLLAVRDDALRTIHRTSTDPKADREAFLTLVSIDSGLKEDQKIVDLFKWVDAQKPAIAKSVYPAAENYLIRAQEYTLCNQYMDAKDSFARILDSYRALKKIPTQNRRILEFAEKNFSVQSATLVAVLAINNHHDQADQVATDATKEVSNPDFAKLLVEARNGTVPPR